MLPYPPLTALPNTLLIMLSLLSTFPLSLMFNPGLTKIEIFFSFFGGRGEGKGEGITGRGGIKYREKFCKENSRAFVTG